MARSLQSRSLWLETIFCAYSRTVANCVVRLRAVRHTTKYPVKHDFLRHNVHFFLLDVGFMCYLKLIQTKQLLIQISNGADHPDFHLLSPASLAVPRLSCWRVGYRSLAKSCRCSFKASKRTASLHVSWVEGR